jgi:hypothetical protein
MAVFKNGIFAYNNGQIVTPQSLGISLAGIQTCQQFFTSGSLIDTTQRYAVYALVADLETYGLWSKMKTIYPMVGQAGVSSSFQLNLKDPSTFKGTFSGSWIFSSTGAKPNGANGYMDTGLIPSASLSTGSTHLSYYSRTVSAQNEVEFGTWLASYSYGLEFSLSRNGGGVSNKTQVYLHNADIGGQFITIPAENSQAFFIATRASTSSLALYRNTSLLNTNTSAAAKSLSTFPLYLAAANNFGTPGNYSFKECAFASVGDGLTDTEAANLYTAVQRFQTTLGRQV